MSDHVPNSAKKSVSLPQILLAFSGRLSSLSARKLGLINLFRQRLEEEKLKELKKEITKEIK